MEIQLTETQNTLLRIISTFGCIDVRQVEILFSNCPSSIQKVLINQLISHDYISLYRDSILVNSHAEDRYDKDTISCIWAMLSLSKEPTIFAEAIPAKSPSKAYFTIGNKTSFEIAVYREGKILTLQHLQERAKNRKTIEKFGVTNWCMFVINDKSLIEHILEIVTDVSFIVALIDDSQEQGIPNVKLYKKKIQ